MECPKDVQKLNMWMQLKKWSPGSTSVSNFGENISAVDSIYIQ
jgi:hypothetical protein